jgi:hypothetical protein
VQIGQVVASAQSNTSFGFQWTEATNLEVGATIIGYEVTITFDLSFSQINVSHISDTTINTMHCGPIMRSLLRSCPDRQ